LSPKILERLNRLVKFLKACIIDKFTGRLIVHFSQGTPIDITKEEKHKLE
jgi:hypothetical protein